MKRAMLIIALIMAGQSGQAAALQPLSSVAFINDGLRSLMIADTIRLNCPDIGARMVKGWAFVRELESKARAMGYSKSQIEDFVESKAQRRRLEGEAAVYMTANGVTKGNPETYCALGHKEISNGSQIGAFLRAK